MAQILRWPARRKRAIMVIQNWGGLEDIGLNVYPIDYIQPRMDALKAVLNNSISDKDLANRIVDIGASNGYFLKALWQRGARNLEGIEPRAGYKNIMNIWAEKLGANIKWQMKRAEDVTTTDIDGAIVLMLGLVYHLHDPDSFFDVLKKSTFKYGFIETEIYATEDWVYETPFASVCTFEPGSVWKPTPDALEAKLRVHSLQCQRLNYPEKLASSGYGRGLWKIWGGLNVADSTMAVNA